VVGRPEWAESVFEGCPASDPAATRDDAERDDAERDGAERDGAELDYSASDVWAVGCMAHELAGAPHPFQQPGPSTGGGRASPAPCGGAISIPERSPQGYPDARRLGAGFERLQRFADRALVPARERISLPDAVHLLGELLWMDGDRGGEVGSRGGGRAARLHDACAELAKTDEAAFGLTAELRAEHVLRSLRALQAVETTDGSQARGRTEGACC
jgi:hypothetical protein